MNKLLIVGTGALATLFAARLAQTKANITILGTWESAQDAFNQAGARLLTQDGTVLQGFVRAISNPAEAGEVDLALVLVKAWQTERVADQLQPYLSPGALVVTLQNGLGNREILAEKLGTERVALGVTTTGASLLAPGFARAGGEGSISLEDHPRISELVKLFVDAHFVTHKISDARGLLWGKLVINTSINPLSALLRVTNGELLERPAAQDVMASLAKETAAVATAAGVHLTFDNPVNFVIETAVQTANNRSSMLQDVERGAPTEIDAICGAVIREGQLHGISTPVNLLMWQLIRALTNTG